jgi:hypothetical protein
MGKVRIRDSVVDLATNYGLGDGGIGSRIFSSPRRPDQLWDPPILVLN